MTLNINNGFRSVVDGEADKFDGRSRAVTVIDEEHRLTHEGFVYHGTHRAADLANDGVINLLLAVPAGAYPHLRKIVYHTEGGPIDIELFEGTTTSAAGTGITMFNRNRNSANTADTVVTYGPTITLDGTLIHDLYSPAGGKDVGSDTNGLAEEWMLATNTQYLLRMTNKTGGIMDYSLELMFYEIKWQNAGK